METLHVPAKSVRSVAASVDAAHNCNDSVIVGLYPDDDPAAFWQTLEQPSGAEAPSPEGPAATSENDSLFEGLFEDESATERKRRRL